MRFEDIEQGLDGLSRPGKAGEDAQHLLLSEMWGE